MIWSDMDWNLSCICCRVTCTKLVNSCTLFGSEVAIPLAGSDDFNKYSRLQSVMASLVSIESKSNTQSGVEIYEIKMERKINMRDF